MRKQKIKSSWSVIIKDDSGWIKWAKDMGAKSRADKLAKSKRKQDR